jgi:hypothetical protein
VGRAPRIKLTTATPINSNAAPFDCPIGINTNSEITSTTKKSLSVMRARLRTSRWVTTVRRCSERPTKSSPARVADAAPLVT